MWDPGQLGGRALARLLFGDVSPSGKLPVTFYKTADSLPDIRDYSMTGRTYRYCAPDNVLYPFGYGLSYADIGFSCMTCTPAAAEVTVTNRSAAAADEVVQLYIRGYSPDDVPNRSLCGFLRVSLQPHESRRVTIPIPAAAYETVLPDGTRAVCGKRFTLFIGANELLSQDITL